MTWPITIPAGTRANTTANVDTHADDHNKFINAFTDLSAVGNALSRVYKLSGNTSLDQIEWDVGAAGPTYPFAGCVVLNGMMWFGYGTQDIDLVFSAYTSGLNSPATGSPPYIISAKTGDAVDPTVSPGYSLFTRVAASNWRRGGSLSLIAPVAADSKPSLVCRINARAGYGNNFYAEGYAAVSYLPGASPSSPVTPSPTYT